MRYKAQTTFLHDQLGKVHMGDEVEMTEQQAQTPIMFGWVEPVEVQSQKETPPPKSSKRTR